MSFALLVTSFFAGILTVLAPCILPLLPVTIGGALLDKNPWRPTIIVTSLALSIIIFTFLLKILTLFINVPQTFWTEFSAGILIAFALTLIFPEAWDWLSFKLNLSKKSGQWLHQASEQQSIWSAILLGAALGPVFSSCSPTYMIILATVLPASLWLGTLYLSAYVLGLAIILALIAMLGRGLINRLKFMANSRGLFKRSLGILLIIIGFSLLLGFDKKAEAFLIDNGIDSTNLEQILLKDIHLKPQNNLGWNKTNINVYGNFGPAPELAGLHYWFNSKPLNLANLKGKVVLLDFWTYTCSLCQHTLGHIEKWNQRYAKQGLVIIGIHEPDFQYEKKPENVLKVIKEKGLTYPIALDNERTTSNLYHNEHTPAVYLIDRQGNMRYFRYGDEDYDKTEKWLEKLLKEPS